MTTPPPPGSLSFADPAIQRCPFPACDSLRDDHPVYSDPLTGHYVLTRYEDVRKALLNVRQLRNRTGLNATRTDPAANALYTDKGWLPLDTLVSNDPPEHRIYRTLVDKVFTTARVAALEPRIATIIEELIAGSSTRPRSNFLARSQSTCRCSSSPSSSASRARTRRGSSCGPMSRSNRSARRSLPSARSRLPHLLWRCRLTSPRRSNVCAARRTKH